MSATQLATIAKRRSGMTMLQMLVCLSIIATLAVLCVSPVQTQKQLTWAQKCALQLNQVAVAIEQYRRDHNGNVPLNLDLLAPRYLGDEHLVCPFLKMMAPEAVLFRQRTYVQRRRSPWASYFYFSQRHLDVIAKDKGEPFGYSDVLKVRGGDTPLVVCRDHREPISLNRFLMIRPGSGLPSEVEHAAENLPRWFFPDAPVVILRWDGRVETTKKGGAMSDYTWRGTDQDLLQL